MTLKFCTLDVFTDHRFGGNPLASGGRNGCQDE
jgi:predicted PhzF superfamily epimerase YddE/YHI9